MQHRADMKNDLVNRQQIAKTILAQLGGNRFSAMTGAKNFLSLDSGLQFDLPARFAKNGINRVIVELTPADLYTVTFFRVTKRGLKVDIISKVEEIYFDQLQETFTDATGLYTSL